MTWKEHLSAAADALASVLLPDACVGCDVVTAEGEGAFCEDCAHLVLDTPDVHCARCAEPGRFERGVCGRCRESPPPFRRAWAPFEHAGAVARAVHRFKYEDRADLSRPLGLLLGRLTRPHAEALPGVVVPVPLHETRFRKRKFDQATLLADVTARVLGRRLECEWLVRVRATERQVGLSDAAREVNLAGAFSASPEVKGADVLLIDDVLTTGATAREATRVLLDAGARSVNVLTLARARREIAL